MNNLGFLGMKLVVFIVSAVSLLFLYTCDKVSSQTTFSHYDESNELLEQQKHKNPRMQFKLIQSKYLDMNEVFKRFEYALSNFSEEKYQQLKPLIVNRSIPAIQQTVLDGKLSYEQITLFYLYRIRKYESQHHTYLNAIISLNPYVLEEAREKDREKMISSPFSVYGLPILLKDNINTKNMATTAGAIVFAENKHTEDAFIVQQLKMHGALILGKANLSEWAYYFCGNCPSGYSAVGGQTLNPYGRKIFSTGGSSSGSGVSVAADYAVAAIGTETSGSILSPSSKNSLVGLKPSAGLLSRGGIVPISSTLDTPGPMTRSVQDNAILLAALLGKDEADPVTQNKFTPQNILSALDGATLVGKKFGAMQSLAKDSLYTLALQRIEKAGGEIIFINMPSARIKNFSTILKREMRRDLPQYIQKYGNPSLQVSSIESIIAFNKEDSGMRVPYGQALFEAMVQKEKSISPNIQETVKEVRLAGRTLFDTLIEEYQLDALLSINNYHASYAAAAGYPCLTVPMGYTLQGEPCNITFIGKAFSEDKLLGVGYAYEKTGKVRVSPPLFDN